MIDDSLTVAGIPIPSSEPLFLSVLAIHVLAGLTCVVVGLAAMLSRKMRGRHSRAGSVYYWSMSVVFASMAILSGLRWEHNKVLFGLGVLAFGSASVGRWALRHRWSSWVRTHIAGMGFSYIILLTAFYVDNGPHLPLWKHLPTLAYWTVPVAVGAPFLVRALLRHPLLRQQASR